MSCSSVNIHIPFNAISLSRIYPKEVTPKQIYSMQCYLQWLKENNFSNNIIVKQSMLIHITGLLNKNTKCLCYNIKWEVGT